MLALQRVSKREGRDGFECWNQAWIELWALQLSFISSGL